MRKRDFAFALVAALSACAPAPAHMSAAQAAEVLNLFASGQGPANVCSADGRAVLRAAVRAYSVEMQRSGVAWPAVPGASNDHANVTHVDISVVIAFAAGFVKSNDFRAAPRRFMNQLTLAQWPEIRSMRIAARQACNEVMALQTAAADFVIESARYQEMTDPLLGGRRDADRVRRQSVRLQRAEDRMLMTAAEVEARMEAQAL